jgi:alkyldihydroxyacetonephosphate synthase
MRTRSFWGWGFTDMFPDDSGLKALAIRVAPVVGEVEARPAPAIEAVTLPPSRLEPPPALAAFTSADSRERITHTYGRAYRDLVRGFAGDFRGAPDLVARPSTEDEVERVLEWATGARVAVVPFGGGTSVVGGVEPPPGWSATLSLDLGRLGRVAEIDDVSRAARIQAGALGPSLEDQLGQRGFTLRHYPQSFEFSTLGGWIATRAGGHFATLYTHIDELVESVRMLTPRGVWQSRRLPGSGAGPSPDRLALGSEGILGVITEAWMRILPRPRWKASASVHFADFAAAVAATREIAQSGLHPSNCRLLDPREALVNIVASDGSAVLLLAFESADHAVDAWIDRAMAIASSHGGRCPAGVRKSDDAGKKDAAGAWRAAFFGAPYLQSAFVSLGVLADTFETACTWEVFPDFHREVVAAVEDALRRVCGGGLVTCRFTHVYPDGPAPYYTFLGKAKVGGELEQWAEIKRAASDTISRMGGTITHHHAVGRSHRPWYDRERPEPFAMALRAAKRELDPAGILNPGVLIDAGATE